MEDYKEHGTQPGTKQNIYPVQDPSPPPGCQVLLESGARDTGDQGDKTDKPDIVGPPADTGYCGGVQEATPRNKGQQGECREDQSWGPMGQLGICRPVWWVMGRRGVQESVGLCREVQ